MENKSKPLKRVIVACIAFCALFVAYISIQSWGTVEYLQEEFSGDLTARFALIGVRYLLALGLTATLLVFLGTIAVFISRIRTQPLSNPAMASCP